LKKVKASTGNDDAGDGDDGLCGDDDDNDNENITVTMTKIMVQQS